MQSYARRVTDLFATASLGAPENAVGFVLWRVVHRYQREVDRILLPLDLTHLQFTILTLAAWLGREGRDVTQAELARQGDIHPMQVSQMLKTLELKDMVTRKRSDADPRAKCIEATAAGLGVLRKALPMVVDMQRAMFGTEGLPGGNFLEALLKLDTDHRDSR